MAVSYPVTPPTNPGFEELDFRLATKAGSAESEFTNQEQVTLWPGQKWIVKGLLPLMETREKSDPWKSFLSKVDGIAGTFYLMPETPARTPRGTATAATVSGAAQLGNTIALAGSGTLVEGQFIQLGSGATSRLHIIVTGGSLPYTADIRPPLRESPGNGSAVVLTNPKGVFRMTGNVVGWSVDRARMIRFEFEAREAF